MSLEVKNLKVSVGEFILEVDHLKVERGEILAVMGKSGCGKSTLLNALLGFLKPRTGEIRVDGASVTGVPTEKRRMAMVFQDGALFPHMTVEGNLEFPLKLQGVASAERKEKVNQWLERLGLSGLGGRYPHEISGGQGQRVALGRALITGFGVLLMDEPLSALDGETRVELRKVIRELVTESRVAALMVTHDKEDAETLADRVHRL